MDEKLQILKTVEVQAGKRRYTVDRKPGTNGLPDYFVLTEHKGSKRFKVVITGADVEKIVNAITECAR